MITASDCWNLELFGLNLTEPLTLNMMKGSLSLLLVELMDISGPTIEDCVHLIKIEYICLIPRVTCSFSNIYAGKMNSSMF